MQDKTSKTYVTPLAKITTTALALTLAALMGSTPISLIETGGIESNNTGLTKSEKQVFSVSSFVKVKELKRDSYAVLNLVEERKKEKEAERQAQLASVGAETSFLEYSKKSVQLHDKADGTVIFPLIEWNFNSGLSGYESPQYPDHHGLDLPINQGTDIYAIADGVVVENSFEAGGYGNFLKIKHIIGGVEVESTYGHMVESARLKVGNKILRGDIIGKVGSTGRSTGPHLHFEIRIDGERQDPGSWLDLNAIR